MRLDNFLIMPIKSQDLFIGTLPPSLSWLKIGVRDESIEEADFLDAINIVPYFDELTLTGWIFYLCAAIDSISRGENYVVSLENAVDREQELPELSNLLLINALEATDFCCNVHHEVIEKLCDMPQNIEGSKAKYSSLVETVEFIAKLHVALNRRRREAPSAKLSCL